MKDLLYKEWKLATHPTTYLFAFFGLMVLIPSYPYYIAFMYAFLAIFFIFIFGRENHDVYFTVLLPVRKADIVKARLTFIYLFELANIIISIPFAILNANINPNGSNLAGLEANVAFYGIIFLMFAIFNRIVIAGFYKTAYKIGMSVVVATVIDTFLAVIVEVLFRVVPGWEEFLDTTEPAMMIKQLPILFVGLAAYILAYFLTKKAAIRNFEKVDI